MRPTLHPGWRLAIFLLALTLLAAAMAGAFYALHFPPQRSHGILQPLPMLGSGIGVIAVALGATLFCLHFLEARPLASIGLAPGRRAVSGLGVGLILGAIVPLLVCAALWASGCAAIVLAPLSGTVLLTATLPMTAATLLLSSWEEIAFRGYGLQLINEMSRPWVGAAITGITFGLAHSGNPGANLLGFANTAVNGILLGWVVIRTGSLWLTCGYHAGWNLTATMLLGMTDSGTVSPGSVLGTTLSGPTWLSGGPYGFEASILTGLMETVVLAAILYFTPRLPSVPEALPYFAGRR